MHLANQSSGKPDTLSQGSTKLDKLSQSSMGGTLDKKGKSQTPERDGREPILRRDPGSRAEGNARLRNNPDSRQPMLQEAMIQA